MKYYKNGKTIETPYYVVIEGVAVELTSDQLARIGYMTESQMAKKTNETLSGDISISKTRELMSTQIEVEAPEGGVVKGDTIEMPFKLGYKWVPSFDNGRVVYTLVPDPNAMGTENNPIIYLLGVTLMPNAFYSIGNKLYVYTGPKDTVKNYGYGMVDMEEWVVDTTDPEIELVDPVIETTDENGKVVANDAEHPYDFFGGVELVPNTYWSYDGLVYVYVGQQTVATTWEAAEADMELW